MMMDACRRCAAAAWRLILGSLALIRLAACCWRMALLVPAAASLALAAGEGSFSFSLLGSQPELTKPCEKHMKGLAPARQSERHES